MKVHQIWLLLTVLLLTFNSAQASSLRKRNLEQAEEDEDCNPLGGGDADTGGGEDESDASLLNRLIQMLLPSINTAISALVPDPLWLPVDGSLPLGRIPLGVCTAGADFNYEFGTLAGLSSITIDTLKVVVGTETIETSDDCFLGTVFGNLWNAQFEIAINSPASLTMEDLNAGFSASACGLTLGSAVDGGSEVFSPTFKGLVNLTGTLFGDSASIDWADFFKGNLDIGYERVEAWLGENSEDAFNRFTREVTGNISMAMKEELVKTVSPKTTPEVEKGLVVGKQSLKLSETLPITLGFRKNAAKKSFARAYSSTVALFGFGGRK